MASPAITSRWPPGGQKTSPEEKGKFVALDDFYDSITFLEPPMPGDPIGEPRYALPIDLAMRT